MSTNPNIAKSMDNANGHISAPPDDSSNGNPSNPMSNGADSNQMASSQTTTMNPTNNIAPKAPLQKPSTTITRPPRQSDQIRIKFVKPCPCHVSSGSLCCSNGNGQSIQ